MIKFKIKYYFSCILLICLLIVICNNSIAQTNVNIIPKPVSIKEYKGEFIFTSSTQVVAITELTNETVIQFNEYLYKYYGFRISVTKDNKPGKGKIFIKIIKDSIQGYYKLRIDSDEIEISGSESGIFYAFQSLKQMLKPAGKKMTLVNSCEILDFPRYNWRGMHLDVSRHFVGIDSIKKYIDYISFYKMNVFHWHLTDDQGWRIEIKKYPKLTKVGGYRNGTLIGAFSEFHQKFDTIRYGGYYTQEEIKDVVEYARKRNVTIVPEIEMPGHSLAAISAYPEYSCSGGSFETAKIWGVFDDVYCSKDSTIYFLADMLNEVMELFPGEYIHIGGDECPKTRWKTCSNCQKIIKREGLKNEIELQSYFIKRIEKIINAKGKKLIGWDEILDGGLAPNAAVMSWRGIQGGIDAAKQGHFVVMTPGSHCYFDHYQANPKSEPLAIGGYTTVEKVYFYDPTPSGLTENEQKYIMGAQGNVWTEYMTSFKHMEYMVFPRICALSEVLWSPKENRNWDEFKTRLTKHFNLLDKMGINYSKTINESTSSSIKLINDSLQLFHINKQFNIQRELAKGRNFKLFEVFKNDLSKNEYLALQFLFAYMPLSDLADYSGQYYLDNVKMSLKARNEMLWGKTVPESIFLHFVLPVRVNNENLDSFRINCYDELKSRVSGLSMYKAALEVNHWCHEKVTYKGSDERTSSPLSSMRYSFGRCGEESTFTVSALRMVGIPARQVYTPRWAHSDDNHAWVEVWVDGKWYFMGACEPELDLNMGWFAAPALRTMLVHTRAFGWYNDTEQSVTKNETFSELNLIENYAPAKQITIKVIDEKLNPVEKAKVEFQLYNYSEFFPIASTYTESNGITSIKMGLGDIIVWAYKDDNFGYQKISVETTDTLNIVISNKSIIDKVEEFDLNPPVERETVKASNEGRAENDLRLTEEDKIRNKYMSTFKDSLWASIFAKSLNLNIDSCVLYITKSYGNWNEITLFIRTTKPESRSYALKLLSVISDKDLRDTKASILTDYLNNALKYLKKYKGQEEIWAKYVLCGRVSSEMMVSSKEFYNLDFFSSLGSNDLNLSPLGIKEIILKKITINNSANALSRNPITPVGVYELKVADLKSRDIFFVAMCRANGFAARIQPETLVPQYLNKNNWVNVFFDTKPALSENKGFITLINKSSIDPKYYIHFTLAIFKNGVYRSLQFEEEKTLSSFSKQIEVPVGKYMLVTGSRQQNGSVLSRIVNFELNSGETKEIEVKVREYKIEEKPWGKINTETFLLENYLTKQKLKLSDLVENKSFVIIYIDPDKEPTKHVMVDIQTVKFNFEKWGGELIFLIKEKNISGFNKEVFSGLPSQSKFFVDNNEEILKEISKQKTTSLENDLPVIIVGDNKGNLTYFSKGYKIGVGEQLVKKIK